MLLLTKNGVPTGEPGGGSIAYCLFPIAYPHPNRQTNPAHGYARGWFVLFYSAEMVATSVPMIFWISDHTPRMRVTSV